MRRQQLYFLHMIGTEILNHERFGKNKIEYDNTDYKLAKEHLEVMMNEDGKLNIYDNSKSDSILHNIKKSKKRNR
jgi:hypothetical protein